MSWKNWSYWLKGGIISLGFVGGISLLFLIYCFIACEAEGCIGCIYVSSVVLILFVISFPLGALIGLVIKKVSRSNGTFSSKGLKAGFWIGLIFAILTGIYLLLTNKNMWTMDYGAGGLFWTSGTLILVMVIGWVIGKIKNR